MMSFRTLEIEVGGLCMYVRRQNPPGLYVLMPDVPAHHGRQHCPMLIADKHNTPSGKRMIYPLKGRVLDLSYLNSNPAVNCDLSWTLDVSKFGGNVRVADNYITDDPVDCLASRIRLPLSSCPIPEANRARMRVDGFPDKLRLAGRATITINVTDPADGLIHVPDGDDLHPHAGRIQITLANVPREDLDRINHGNHAKNDVADHYQAFFSLLEGFCDSGQSGPAVIIDEDGTDGDPNDPAPMNCETKATEASEPIVARWVDTHTCSSGQGG